MGTGSVASDCCCACSGSLPEPSVWGAILGVNESAMDGSAGGAYPTLTDDERTGIVRLSNE
jgi:hypothetical protein